MNEKNPYKVPQGYFDSLQQSILQKTVESGREPHRAIIVEHEVVRSGSAVRSMLGFAAGFAVFVCLAWGGFYMIMGGEMKVSEGELTAEEEVLWGGGNEEFIDMIVEEDSYTALLAEEVTEYIDFWGVGNIDITLDFEE